MVTLIKSNMDKLERLLKGRRELVICETYEVSQALASVYTFMEDNDLEDECIRISIEDSFVGEPTIENVLDNKAYLKESFNDSLKMLVDEKIIRFLQRISPINYGFYSIRDNRGYRRFAYVRDSEGGI